ncbi:hypothetical protein HPB51_010593 [Rhipicephalus microplus]|uniref:THAP-type domain-containing protein n=1 Tax=Rhipicephalus microplus TaxID=6941 RepID=A0A9J6E7W2_RHIMP|nr:hypothetical protein HPB51_010593 [Rhipicephalus microplus]
MPEKKGRTCFVPLCKGGYKSFKEKVSLFRAPADPVRLQEWARNIKRGDKVLDETCVVCSRHFDDRYIQRTFKHVINGEDVEFDRERPSLTPDAVPTIFPDGPAYLTKPVPRKRKESNIADCTAPPAKRKAPNEPTTSQACDDAAAGEETAQAPHPFHSTTPPSAFCSKMQHGHGWTRRLCCPRIMRWDCSGPQINLSSEHPGLRTSCPAVDRINKHRGFQSAT